MSERTTGSCLCGAVRFEIEGQFEQFFLCHCSHCRKDTGSAHAANLFSSTAQLRWLGGRDQVSHFNLAPTRHSRSFCAACGSALPFQDAAGGLLTVPAGSLDGDVGMRPQAHIFVSSKADWDDRLAELPVFATFPAP